MIKLSWSVFFTLITLYSDGRYNAQKGIISHAKSSTARSQLRVRTAISAEAGVIRVRTATMATLLLPVWTAGSILTVIIWQKLSEHPGSLPKFWASLANSPLPPLSSLPQQPPCSPMGLFSDPERNPSLENTQPEFWRIRMKTPNTTGLRKSHSTSTQWTGQGNCFSYQVY